MKAYLVWEDECPEEGSFEIEAEDEDDAIAKYRAETNQPDLECSATLMTLEEATRRAGALLTDALPPKEPERSKAATERADEVVRMLTVARAQTGC